MEDDAEAHELAARSLPMTARPPRASRPNLRHVCGAQQGTAEPGPSRVAGGHLAR
jgi:hypothetical protein